MQNDLQIKSSRGDSYTFNHLNLHYVKMHYFGSFTSLSKLRFLDKFVNL